MWVYLALYYVIGLSVGVYLLNDINQQVDRVADSTYDRRVCHETSSHSCDSWQDITQHAIEELTRVQLLG